MVDGDGGDACERAFFEGEVGVRVDVGRSDGFVAEPECDGRGVDSLFEELHRARVAKDVG